MRNPVSRHDFNRASVHTDQKKAWEPDILDGLEEHFLEIDNPKEDEEELDPKTLALAEYRRGVKASGIV
ncbi:hypothetical protein GECvBMG_gp100c [Salmonella phage GEC_vB_MG]|uniref:Uncharacterized protein 93 n=1 Tax=Salmonella phage PVPSE1 TaxID=889338 RepID=G3BLV8_9CAUD|nr:hypothetical protein PVP-SE1_gp092 [Salmonella phage PVPSE1]ADP02488.1 conserved hypothetical protein [Salmonella phage PVPSE1]QPI14644.1 hypothetical protein GECvBMG_gp100c [Salmonella phage GEC_vB_MG]